jgi:hypothetical protein
VVFERILAMAKTTWWVSSNTKRREALVEAAKFEMEWGWELCIAWVEDGMNWTPSRSYGMPGRSF